MTKTESVLITSELRKINQDVDRLKQHIQTLSQDIEGSATLYGRKSKIKGPAKDKDGSQVRSTEGVQKINT